MRDMAYYEIELKKKLNLIVYKLKLVYRYYLYYCFRNVPVLYLYMLSRVILVLAL